MGDEWKIDSDRKLFLLTFLEDVDVLDFSLLLVLPEPFSISQRFPLSVGLPRAARACRRSLRNEKSGNVNDDRFRRIFCSLASFNQQKHVLGHFKFFFV